MISTNNKKEVYDALKAVEHPNLKVYQANPEVVESFPAVTFFEQMIPVYELEGAIGTQEVEMTIDIWTQTPKEGIEILSKVEQSLVELGYRLTYSVDVPDPLGVAHRNCLFNLIK